MTKIRLKLNMLAVFAVCLFCSALVQAQATRTWVSGVGDDANPCSRTAPCKTFAGAISKTAEGGEIDALDPGGFGAVTIVKSITLDGGTGAGFASILVAGTNGVVVAVNTNPTTSVVTLRHLNITGIRHQANPASAGLNGIRFTAGKNLFVENCYVFGFGQNGLDVNNSTTNPNVVVEDSYFSDNAASGISVTATSAVGAAIKNTTVKGNANGISSAANAKVTISNCTIVANSSNGINTASGSETNLSDSKVSGNGTGFNIVGGATGRLENNLFAQNLTGVANNGTGVSPAANNKFMGNVTDRSGGAFIANSGGSGSVQ